MALLAAGADIAVHYGPATVRIPDPEHVRAFPGSISADCRNGPVKREGCADFS